MALRIYQGRIWPQVWPVKWPFLSTGEQLRLTQPALALAADVGVRFEVGTHPQQAGKAPLFDHLDGRQVVERFVAGAHPPVSQVPVLREQQAQAFVDAQQVPHSFVLAAAGTDGLASAVVRQRSAVAAGNA